MVCYLFKAAYQDKVLLLILVLSAVFKSLLSHEPTFAHLAGEEFQVHARG